MPLGLHNNFYNRTLPPLLPQSSGFQSDDLSPLAPPTIILPPLVMPYARSIRPTQHLIPQTFFSDLAPYPSISPLDISTRSETPNSVPLLPSFSYFPYSSPPLFSSNSASSPPHASLRLNRSRARNKTQKIYKTRIRVIRRFHALASMLDEKLPESKPSFIANSTWEFFQNRNFVKIKSFKENSIELNFPSPYDPILDSLLDCKNPKSRASTPPKTVNRTIYRFQTASRAITETKTRFRWWSDTGNREILKIKNRALPNNNIMRKFTLPKQFIGNPYLNYLYVIGDQQLLKKELSFFYHKLVEPFTIETQNRNGDNSSPTQPLPKPFTSLEEFINHVAQETLLDWARKAPHPSNPSELTFLHQPGG